MFRNRFRKRTAEEEMEGDEAELFVEEGESEYSPMEFIGDYKDNMVIICVVGGVLLAMMVGLMANKYCGTNAQYKRISGEVSPLLVV